MPFLQRLRILVMTSLTSWSLGACTPDKVLYEGTHNGLDFVVKAHETQTWNGSRTDWILKLEGYPELPIFIRRRRGTPVEPDGAVSTDWGPPYSDDIYGKFERIYLGNAPAYSNKGDDYRDSVDRQHDYTMLYMPGDSDVTIFAAYSALLKAEWAAVNKALASDDASYFPHFIGLVNAPRYRFVRSFRGTVRGQSLVLRIDPDGYVNFGLDNGFAELNNMRHCVVQMPQKEIILSMIYGWQNYPTTKADLLRFRDSQGKSPEAYFRLTD